MARSRRIRMLRVLFTLDYEIHGNGEGSPHALMFEPTDRMLRLFEEYGAKLTIMADVAEILKFREYAEKTGRDDFHSAAITAQLRDAIRRGHDVQLHLHSSYFNAAHRDGRWQQDWSEYNFAGLPLGRMVQLVRNGKEFLETLLAPVDSSYRCTAFRAANWSVSPSPNVVEALVCNGIEIDTSVFKYGRRDGIVSFDYTGAHSDLLPWRVDARDICKSDRDGALMEFPIYAERRWLGAFFSWNRLYRAMLSRRHRFAADPDFQRAQSVRPGGKPPSASKLSLVFKKHAWKADFNQCTGRQLIGALRRAEARYASHGADLPFILIGHSKLFTRANERSLRPFLRYVSSQPARMGFGTFRDFGRPARLSPGLATSLCRS
jgi:hypothetical protein